MQFTSIDVNVDVMRVFNEHTGEERFFVLRAVEIVAATFWSGIDLTVVTMSGGRYTFSPHPLADDREMMRQIQDVLDHFRRPR